jgi:hypothetical protein
VSGPTLWSHWCLSFPNVQQASKEHVVVLGCCCFFFHFIGHRSTIKKMTWARGPGGGHGPNWPSVSGGSTSHCLQQNSYRKEKIYYKYAVVGVEAMLTSVFP